jgi:hypothetical protein
VCDITSGSGTNAADPGVPNNCWRVRGSYDGTLTNAGIGWALEAPQYTQGAEFDVSTVNYSGIVFTFDWFTTNQGVHNMQVQYYTGPDSGWQNIGPILNSFTNGYVPGGETVDFSSIAAANDNPNFRVRLVSVYDPTYNGTTPSPWWPHLPTYSGASGTQYNNNSGNWRFDRITFKGTPVRSVAPACSGTVTPTAVCGSGGQITFSVSVDSGVQPLSTGLTVTADLSSIGLSSTQQLFDNGTNGDVVSGDSVFTYTATVPAGQLPGNRTIPVTVSDAQSRSGNTTIPVVVGDCSTNSSSRVVISQTFGGGGHLGVIPQQDAPYDADYVELYNRSGQTVSLDGWSVQYASPASATGFDNIGDQVLLSGNIQPGQHVLVRMSDPVPGFVPLPTPDFAQITGFGGMGDTGGRVALVRSTLLMGTNFNDPSIEDLIGYGSSAIAYEGAAPAPTPSPSSHSAMVRQASGNQDTNQNFIDFVNGTPLAHNRSSGGFLTGYASSDVTAVCSGSVVTFTVNAIPSSTTTSMTVTADVSDIVGSPTTVQLFDDGTHGDVTANNSVFTLAYTVPANAVQGNRTVHFTVTDPQGHTDTSSLPLAIGNCQDSGAPVVISQVYGGGGNDTSGYNGDFAEIFNRSNHPVNLTGWSFQSARVSDQGFDSRIVLLSGTMNPGEYRLIIANQLSPTGAVLPAADFVPSAPFGMESSFGRVCLVSTQNLVHTDYTRSDVVDLVGYGNYNPNPSFEGVAPTGTLDDIHLAVRKQGGCLDTNQNGMDFDVVLALALPHNSASPAHPCGPVCGSADFNCDGDIGTDLDIEAFFACLAGSCPPAPCTNNADFNGDGDIGTDADIEAFFRVLAGGNC